MDARVEPGHDGEESQPKNRNGLVSQGVAVVGDGDADLLEMRDRTREYASELDMSLPRLLAINLGIGIAVAVLLVGGLLVLNPGGLRDLIFADRSPFVPIFLLLGGFVVTFASTAMGTAIMAMGESDDEPRGGLRVVKQRADARR